MNEFVHIIKGSIRNVVDKNQFERVYKPQGWEIDKEYQEEKKDENLGLLRSENEIINYSKSKKRKYIFDDKLFKE